MWVFDVVLILHSTDYTEKLLSFHKAVIRLRKKESIAPCNIINMDQTMCHLDMPPSRSNSKKGEKTIRIKATRAEKKGFTVSLAGRVSQWREATSCDHFQREGWQTWYKSEEQTECPSKCMCERIF